MRLREAIEKALPLAPAEEGEVLARPWRIWNARSISTIHSFCASLLRERPVEASIDPNFEPLDEIGMDLLFQEIWDQWLGQEMEKKAGGAAPGPGPGHEFGFSSPPRAAGL